MRYFCRGCWTHKDGEPAETKPHPICSGCAERRYRAMHPNERRPGTNRTNAQLAKHAKKIAVRSYMSGQAARFLSRYD